MDGNFVNFRVVYDDLTNEVMRSQHQFIPDHLYNWFERLDGTPQVRTIVAALEQSAGDFESWQTDVVSSEELKWPRGREKRLGMQLALFRKMANEQIDVFDFAHIFTYSGSNDTDSTTYAFTDQVFGPMARDLRMLLQERIGEGGDIEEVPASDRVVRIDHNSAEYRDAIEALDTLEHTLRTANDFDDLEEKEQRIAEVQASKTLLQAVRVRVQALIELLRPLGVQFGNKLKDNLITIAVSGVITALGALLKIIGLL